MLRDELLELPVELEPEVPAGSSGADLEAKADPEYLASLITNSAAENAVSAAAAAEPYVDPANPIGVAGHVDVPDLQ